MIKSLFLLICTALLLTQCLSCAGVSTPPTAAKDKPAEIALEDLVGFYRTDLPCASCEKIQTTLILTKDQHFDLIYDYYKAQETFRSRDQGKFNYRPSTGRLKLVHKDTPHHFSSEKDALLLLDQEQNKIEGELADFYRLVKWYDYSDSRHTLLVSPKSIRKDESNHMHFHAIWTFPKPLQGGQRSLSGDFIFECNKQRYTIKQSKFFSKSFAGGDPLPTPSNWKSSGRLSSLPLLLDIARLECED